LERDDDDRRFIAEVFKFDSKLKPAAEYLIPKSPNICGKLLNRLSKSPRKGFTSERHGTCEV
jgi:hypothetical protein